MYQTPQLTMFGTFRDITLSGRYGQLDGPAGRSDGCSKVPVTRCS
jgi:hypothetical protein